MALLLPDLPSAAQLWIADEYDFATDGSEWQLMLPADPTRWFLVFIGTPGADVGDYWVTTKPVAGTLLGSRVPQNQRVEFEYQKFASTVGLAWYINPQSAIGTVRYFESLIRKTKIPTDQ